MWKKENCFNDILSRVAEGVKLIKQNRIKEAMEHYKRALDMDPKYAEGWFHVAEG